MKNTQRIAAPPAIGTPTNNKPGQWVQTERKAHEAWAQVWMSKPRAAALMHLLVSQMQNNAVVISQKLLAKLMGCSLRTIQYASADLVAEKWIQVVRLNGPGTISAYVINDRVAWGQPRNELRLSVFSAAVVADYSDQDAITLEAGALRRIPTIFPGEIQMPVGDGMEPPSQPNLPGMEVDLPASKANR